MKARNKIILTCLLLANVIIAGAPFSINNELPNHKKAAIADEAVTTTSAAVARGAGAIISGTILLLGLAVPASSAGDVMAGEQLFRANCAACHSGGKNVIMPEKTLEKEALEMYLYGGRNEGSVIRQVTNGKNAMPAFGGRLQDVEIESIASFVIAKSGVGWDSDIILPAETGRSTEIRSDGTLVESEMKITNILDLPSGKSLAIVERIPAP